MKIDISNYDFLPLNFIIAPVKDIHAFIFASTSLSTYYVLGIALDFKRAGKTKTRFLSSESSISPLSPVGGFISTPPFPIVGPQGLPAG